MADVGDEVAAHPGDPVRLGDVGGLDGDEVAAERDRPQVRRRAARRPPSPRGRSSSTSRRDAGAADLAGEGAHDRVRDDRCRASPPARSRPIARAAGLTSTTVSSASSTTTPTRSESRLLRPSPGCGSCRSITIACLPSPAARVAATVADPRRLKRGISDPAAKPANRLAHTPATIAQSTRRS